MRMQNFVGYLDITVEFSLSFIYKSYPVNQQSSLIYMRFQYCIQICIWIQNAGHILIMYNLIKMAKKSGKPQLNGHQSTKKIKKSTKKIEDEELPSEDQDSQESSSSLQISKKQQPKKRNKKHKHTDNQQSINKYLEQSVKEKIQNAFDQQQQIILRRIQQGSQGISSDSGEEQSEDNEHESSQEDEISVSTPSEDQQQSASNQSEKGDVWEFKNKKKKKQVPEFHRKIQINYEIMDAKSMKNSSVECVVDGKKMRYDQRGILANLEGMRKSLQKLQQIFRNSAVQSNEVEEDKPTQNVQNITNLIEKYSRPIKTSPVKDSTLTIANEKIVSNQQLQMEIEKPQKHKKQVTSPKLPKEKVHKRNAKKKNDETKIRIE